VSRFTPVVRVDTGYGTRATHRFVDQLTERLGLDLRVFAPDGQVIGVPPALDDPGHADFVRAVEIEPFSRALDALRADAWLSSIRRYQTEYRRDEPVVRTLDSGLPKVSPLLDRSARTVARYAAEHGLPIGPEAFDPTKGEAFRECGLHLAVGS